MRSLFSTFFFRAISIPSDLSIIWHAVFIPLGSKISGHRGYFLTNDGVDLNQALINYGLNFLRTKGFKKIQAPFMMRKNVMSATAQLEEFDDELYKVRRAGAEDLIWRSGAAFDPSCFRSLGMKMTST